MDTTAYILVLVICLVFNICAFVVVWVELRGQRKRIHDAVGKLTDLWAGVVNVLLDHESRIAAVESSQFRPASVFEKMQNKELEISFRDRKTGKSL